MAPDGIARRAVTSQDGGVAGSADEVTSELAAHERRLQRSAVQHAVGVGDEDLRRILAFVRDRRARRTGAAGPLEGAPVPASSGPHAREDEPRAQAAAATATTIEPSPSETATAGAAGAVLAVTDVGPTVRILRLGRPAELRFRAGQYIRVGLAGNRRGKFSIASAPHDGHVEVCVQLIPGGRLTPALFRVGVGDRVEVGSSAKGSFQLDARASTHLMVATSTGIAPFRSMVRDAHRRRGDGDRILILHGASHVDELPYLDELAGDAGVEYTPTISRPGDARNHGWTGATGRVDPLAITTAAALDPSSTHVYACGNKGMVDAVTQELGGQGFGVSREVYD